MSRRRSPKRVLRFPAERAVGRRPAGRRPRSVSVELDEPVVADPEVVSDLVQDDALDLAPQPFQVGAVQSLERAAEDSDLVG